MTHSARGFRSPPRADRPFSNLRAFLDPHEESAARSLIWRILQEVPASLVEAALFGSRARGTARPESDVDILLVFERLPPDREPQAGIAERVAHEVATRTGVPLTVWSVSVDDTRVGFRTPMLVDALADAIPIWCWPEPIPPIDFTPADALYCCDCLQKRVSEGGDEFENRLSHGDAAGAALRARDDIVRLCTAALLLRGITRPRRAEAVHFASSELLKSGHGPPALGYVLEWAAASFGPGGMDEEIDIQLPACDPPTVATVIEYLRRVVRYNAERLAQRVRS